MNKRYLHHLWTRLRKIKPIYFLIIALISSVICVFALRANNQHMAVLRQNVYNADKDNADVKGALQALQAYVTAHMNTSLNSGQNTVYPPIQLKYTYERAIQAQTQALTGDQLYTAAQQYCEGQNSQDFSGRNRVPCIEQYVQAHGAGQTPAVPDALYKFAFVSPRWSPDLAGWSMVVASISWLLFATSFAVNRWLKRHST